MDLGPGIHLVRFTPTFDIYRGQAIEARNGALYVAYYPRGPEQWGFTGGEPNRLGILSAGQISPVFTSAFPGVSQSDQVWIEGLNDGWPVVRSMHDGRDRYFLVRGERLERLSNYTPHSMNSPCISFDGGRLCDVDDVRFTDKAGRTRSITGTRYVYEQSPMILWPSLQASSNVWLAGGGRHHFLLVEYLNMIGAAECLEGYAP